MSNYVSINIVRTDILFNDLKRAANMSDPFNRHLKQQTKEYLNNCKDARPISRLAKQIGVTVESLTKLGMQSAETSAINIDPRYLNSGAIVESWVQEFEFEPRNGSDKSFHIGF